MPWPMDGFCQEDGARGRRVNEPMCMSVNKSNQRFPVTFPYPINHMVMGIQPQGMGEKSLEKLRQISCELDRPSQFNLFKFPHLKRRRARRKGGVLCGCSHIWRIYCLQLPILLTYDSAFCFEFQVKKNEKVSGSSQQKRQYQQRGGESVSLIPLSERPPICIIAHLCPH